ncbi:MAG: FtsX-like permease family protein [Clostridiales bacterium]|jgi:hypothetical protein|nr:FtsX-like permease family protein [Clostridiales bacterium]
MKVGFYPKLAASGIRKNKRMFIPFILTCTGMVMMFYIIMFLAVSNVLDSLIGAETLRQIFALGSWVIAVFAAIFLFYTNSFLIRRRKKEFGLYNILGMGKRNIAWLLLWETLIIAVISIGAGLVAGIAFSKFAELGMVNIMHGDVTYNLSISFLAIKRSVQVFGVIFLLLLLHSIRQVRFANAISLMRSENTGEKPPKGNWVIGILGILLLAVAYYLAVTIKDPITAILTFFAAVIMVIVGTYLVMISGSVLFCQLLQKKKNYYYKPNHFVSVSSMVYRMKRNGAGLASICILATMVLVMMASTACLYFGQESSIRERYPRDINMVFHFRDSSDLSDTHIQGLKEGLDEEIKSRDITMENDYCYRSIHISGVLKGNTVQLNKFDATDILTQMRLIYFVPLSDYNNMVDAKETLEDGEALIYTYRGSYDNDTIAISDYVTFKIKRHLDDFLSNGDSAMNMLDSIAIVVPDYESVLQKMINMADFKGDQLLQLRWEYHFDTTLTPDEQISLYNDLCEKVTDSATKEQVGYKSVDIESQENERADFYGLFGALFYIGIILSLVFILAAVLIIYYKQISEGYEDQSRFEIMQKVGMTKRDIRKTINSQLLTVFFLPLLFAVMHIAFAFPIIRKLLLCFNLNNVPLFAVTTAISIVVFALFYTIVYRLTSNVYYKIVSGVREDR